MQKAQPRLIKSKSAQDINGELTLTRHKLTPEEIYKLSTRQNEWGIEGYEVPRQYFDYNQVLWHRKRQKILESHTHVWPPNDWPRDKEDDKKKIPPKRTSYLDDLYKWCHSFYDPKRRKELIEEQNIDVKDYQPRVYIDKKRRNDFLNNEKKKAEWIKSRPPYPEYKSDAIEAVKNQLDEAKKEKQLTFIEKMKIRYNKDRPQTTRCDRVTIVADAEFVGEQIPFYNTPANEDTGEVNKRKAKLFFPDKTCTWRRAPSWKFNNLKKENENIKEKEKEAKEKVKEYLTSKGLTEKDVDVNLDKTFFRVTHHGELLHRIVKPTEYEKEEHYAEAARNHPDVYVGPQHYWKMPNEKNPKKLKAKMLETTDDKGNKVYYMDRKTTDKRVYKVGMRKSVY